MLMAVAAACADTPEHTTAGPAYTREVVSRHPAAERVVALGDVHGDLGAMREALLLGGIIDERDEWIGGETVVVQTGDLLDRGDDEREILDLVEKLEQQASDAGGALLVLHGNHELMNVALDFRYVTDAGFSSFESNSYFDPSVACTHAQIRQLAFLVLCRTNLLVLGDVLPGSRSSGARTIEATRAWVS